MDKNDEITIYDYYALHQTLWNTIADMTLEIQRKVSKREALEKMGVPYNKQPRNFCYACEYANNSSDGSTHLCENCLIDWGYSGPYEYYCEETIYAEWKECTEGDDYFKESAELARKIANLPINPKLINK